MPDLNVCTGPAFGVGGSGELVVAGSGSHSWTLAGSISANNGLNTDPVNGLWTAPHGCYSTAVQQFADGLSQSLSATAWVFPTTAFTFVNPSTASQMRIAAWVHARMTVNLAASSAAFLFNSPQFVGGAAVRDAYGNIANPTTGAVNGLKASAWDVTETVVAAGATATLNTPCSATLIGGTATLTNWSVWVQYVAWLLDPTQAGGIS